MHNSLRNRFVALGAVMVASVIAMEAAHYVDARNTSESFGRQEILTRVVQRHMESDMMHDAIRGDVMAALLAFSKNDQAERKAALTDFKEHSDSFVRNAHENMAQPGLPSGIKASLEAAQKPLQTYLTTAQALISADTPEGANALLPAFSASFSDLEEIMEKASDAILSGADRLKQSSEDARASFAFVTNVISVIVLLVAFAVPLFAARSIFRPQAQMIAAMQKLAGGDTSIQVPHTGKANEIGEMARALQVFKENALHVQKMTEEQKRQGQLADEQKRQAVHEMAHNFETSVKHVVDMVASAATQMDATSKSVADIAGTNKNRLHTLTGQIESTSRNVQMVASATSELTSAITEINRQVTRATAITSGAVQEAQKADGTVQGLSTAAQKIGEVLEMINSIAAQINLLALNATIEAARAGDAGKGFAVVASEVKSLANQTTKATEEIAQYIGSIQSATTDTVNVIKAIGGTIREINEIATTVAAAVEEQGVATQDIANNVQQAATNTNEVAHNATEVSKSSDEAGEAAQQMSQATTELSRQSETLRREVEKFLNGVRAG